MSGFTNKLKSEMLAAFFRGEATPASYFLALVTSTTAPGADTNTMSDLTEIAAGNGYAAGGTALAKNTTNFISVTEDDSGDKGVLTVRDISFTASGGSIPASGSGARYAVLTGPGANRGERKVYIWIDLLSNRVVSNGQSLNINGTKAEMVEAA